MPKHKWCYFIQLFALLAVFCIFAVPAAGQFDHPYASKVVSKGGYQVLKAKADNTGSVRLIVSLKSDFRPAGSLNRIEAEIQELRIAQLQSAVEERMMGLKMNTTYRYQHVPQMALVADRDAVDALLNDADIASVFEDVPVYAHLEQSIPLIGVPAAVSQGYTGSGWTVAILDTGVDKTHPMLAGSVVSEACYSTDATDISGAVVSRSLCPGGLQRTELVGSAMPYSGACPVPACNHGTHVAGIAAGRAIASGDFNGSGVARSSGIIAIQVFSRFDNPADCGAAQTFPCVRAYVQDIIAGLDRVYSLRSTFNIAAVNLSLGGGLSTSFCDADPRKPIIDSLRAAGIATVVSSGNEGFPVGISAPACISTAVSVGATTDADTIASYSNSAGFLSLLAPGSFIESSIPGGGFVNMSGTSMAAPHVAGAWALLRQANPNMSVAQTLNVLQSTGISILDSRNGLVKPRIQVDSALNAIVCGFTLTPAVSADFPIAGGNGSFTVTTQAGCSWSATTSAPWVSITGGASGTGNGTVTYSVSPNAAYGRTATITVGSKTHTVRQASVPGVTGIGVYANGNWYLDGNRSSVWEGVPADSSAFFGFAGAAPIVGDWNASGVGKAGVYANAAWYLDANDSGTWNGIPADRLAFFGFPGAIPVTGDWNGSGTTNIGVYADGFWYLDMNGNGAWDGEPTDRIAHFGFPGAIPVTGDWNGSGTTNIGVYADGFWYLDMNGNGAWDGEPTDRIAHFGFPGAIPVTGDWNGSGTTKVGVYADSFWYLDQNGNGIWDGLGVDGQCFFGFSGAVPVTGNW